MCVHHEWTQQDVHRRVSQALETLRARDQYLLDQDVHERTIAQRLAFYLEHEFVGWHVDCEYNGDVKSISALKKHPPGDRPSTSDYRTEISLAVDRRAKKRFAICTI